jgi:molecular chaperone GrpE
MVKGKDNIFGNKEGKKYHEKATKEEAPQNESLTSEAENMSASEQDGSANVTEETKQEASETQATSNKEEELTKQVQELQDKYIRLMAEFDNFRKRSLKERTELIKSAGEDILVNILPIMDDFERGLTLMDQSPDIESVKQGVLLIYNKFKEFLTQRGIKEIEAIKLNFNVDLHEAITKIPAPDESLKGKVVDVLQKGYYLGDKVIRYSKVVVGE